MLMKSRFRITALKLLLVLRTRKRYSCDNTGTDQEAGRMRWRPYPKPSQLPSDRGEDRKYLDEELEVDIVGLGRGALGLLVPAAGD